MRHRAVLPVAREKGSRMRRAGKSLLALAVLAMALATATAAVAQPSVAGHNNLQRFAGVTPPTTASCLANNGVACYAPFQFRNAYDLNALYNEGFDGRGRTIAIVDSFGSPTIRNDLHQFDSDFGLPDPKLDIVTPAGAPPPFDPNDSDMVGWAEETTLDVEWAHAIAPGAHILLVETPVSETEGVHGLPGDREVRELRHRPPPRRRHHPELRRDRGDVPEPAVDPRPALGVQERQEPRRDRPRLVG